ncbi:MAG: D-Ala-D-Ala carboxypeptidase family metallohydrolase [Paludibacter sp.]|nr:D-Ala-D-Ala carboxypeptidase family metallohydrolase [Paludibacter sp.]
MQLSKNFTLQELTITNTHLPNLPTEAEIARLQALVTSVLQPLRNMYGHQICVNSGFRSAAVNSAIGGATNSQHCTGEAADLDAADNAAIFQLIRQHLPFDQLIWEGGDNHQPDWVHVSFREANNRKQVLRMKVVGGKKKYESY